jgi:hypothetical protein
MANDDPLDGQEIGILNSILPDLVVRARGGDKEAVDQVIKILQLKRLYKRDKLVEDI